MYTLQNDPRGTSELVSHLESEVEKARLREAETLEALKEMQDKVVELEKVKHRQNQYIVEIDRNSPLT